MEFKSNANIAEIFVNHFKKIYIGTENPSIIIDNLEWRPISLTTSLYKVNAKILADRLKITLHNTIAESQLAFVKGRQITDVILMANEIVDYWKMRKIRGFVPKLDIKKTFDIISWDFIDFMLTKKNYPKKWRKWIEASIRSVQYSILINGKPYDRINPNRGIRQGDPISPFIFILAMDYLSSLLNLLQEEKATKGVEINRQSLTNHILFADDILLFTEDNDTSIKNLLMAITLFEKASGLNINDTKSTLTPINVTKERTNNFTSIWNIPCHPFPINYLGVSLGGKPLIKGFWKHIIEKIHKKLNSWKYQHISKGGNLTLLKGYLTSLPTYQLSVFKAPISIYKEIEKHWRNFMWRSNKEPSTTHLIKWTDISRPKSKEGLGITSKNDTNFTLLCKWLWCFQTEPHALWRKVLTAKFEALKENPY
ncbi:LINE-1 retrotransposable element ORF2 protein [Cucumis melo var. makuwa]|uniref:LINE-1 retrotransposable element ORF2 protein n=1 Tax=Cucumis melo var. makuwa TaxID=1194695 RepID=A0A5D3CKH6_CUCMM|nr:LINE-1 retrotransposable element ORF2 protein [Cucumis melo var. makuwa]